MATASEEFFTEIEILARQRRYNDARGLWDLASRNICPSVRPRLSLPLSAFRHAENSARTISAMKLAV